MKKTLLILTAGLFLFASSCKKDKNEPEPQKTDTTTQPQPEPQPNPNDALAKEVAANKATMESSGVTFVKELEAMQDSKAMSAISNLQNLGIQLKSSAAISNKLPFGRLLNAIKSGSASGTLKSLKTDSNSVDVEAEILDVAGTYTYNFLTNEFDSVMGGSTIVIKFPSDSLQTTNNAEIKLYDLTYTTVPTTANTPYSTIMTGTKAYIKVDGTDVMTFSLTAAYDNDGLPTSVSTTVTVETYTLTYALTHTSSKFTSDILFKNNSTTLLAQGFDISGTITKAKAEELEDYYNDTTISNKTTSKVAEFVSAATVYYQIMDIKIVGSVDATNFTKEADKLIEADDDDADKICNVINSYCSLYGIFASTQKKIADVTIYATIPEGETEKEPALMLTFPDGSKSDAEAYFSDAANFADLKAEIEKFSDETSSEKAE